MSPLRLSVASVLLFGLMAQNASAEPSFNVFNRVATDQRNEIKIEALSDEELDVRMFAGHVQSTDSPAGTSRYVFRSYTQRFDISDELPPDNPAYCENARLQDNRNHRDRRVVVCEGNFAQVQIEGSDEADKVCVIDPEKVDFEVYIDAHGQGGNDVFAGGEHYDELNGEDGSDVIIGRGGDDQLSGYQFIADDLTYEDPDEEPEDPPSPEEGDDDFLYGGPGSDGIWGGPGADTIVGGPGADHSLCGSDAAVWNEALSPSALGCRDKWSRETGGDRLFASESRDLNLETGAWAPTPPQRDEVDCGHPPPTNPSSVQYDAGLDSISRCPAPSTPNPAPPQIQSSYPVPHQLAGLRCPKLR